MDRSATKVTGTRKTGHSLLEKSAAAAAVAGTQAVGVCYAYRYGSSVISVVL
jgi:hypothetical protein